MKTKLLSAKNISTDGGFDYYLFSPIGEDENGDGICGQDFADDLNYIQQYMSDKVKRINIRINSGGGSIVDGLSIVSAIRNCSIPVDTYVEGIGASIAGIIALSGQKRFANDYSRIMIHDPLIDTESDLTPADLEMLANFKSVLITILSNNSGFTADEISKMMTSETWFTAQQALDAGLIDSIVKTERNVGLMMNDSKSVYSFANNIYKQKTKPKMKILFNKLSTLKLIKNNETETDVEKLETIAVETIESLNAKIAELELKKSELETAVETAETKVTETETQVETLTEQIAETKVDEAINAGKIDVAKRAEMVVIAKKDLNTFNVLVGAMTKKAVKVTNVIGANIVNDIVENDGKINGKGLRDLEKSEPKLIERIKNENPDLYGKLYLKQYGVQLK